MMVGWFGLVYGISTFVCYLMPSLFYTNNQFYFRQFSLAWVHSLIVKNISISSYSIYSNSSVLNNSIKSINWTLSGATTPGQSGPGNDGNEGVLRIPQSSSITGTSPSDYFVTYPGHSLKEFYPSAEVQLVYSTAPADWAKIVHDQTQHIYVYICVCVCVWIFLILNSMQKIREKVNRKLGLNRNKTKI